MTIEVIVKTHSRESKVTFKDNIYYVYTKSPAKEGKANKEVIKLLSKYFDIPKTNISIKRGLKYKKKVIQFEDRAF